MTFLNILSEKDEKKLGRPIRSAQNQISFVKGCGEDTKRPTAKSTIFIVILKVRNV